MESAAFVFGAGVSSGTEGRNMHPEMDERPRDETKERSGLDWVLRRVVAIGKKMLVAGIVISSVPVVLPPLVVASALGIAIAVPYGMILASYTCSKKLLNKLLPGTSPCDSLEEDGFALAYKEVEEDYELVGALGMDEDQEVESDEATENLNTRAGMSILSEDPGQEVIQGPVPVRTAELIERNHCKSEKVKASFEVTGVINAEDLAQTNNKKSNNGISGKMEATTKVEINGRKGKMKGMKKEKADENKLLQSSNDMAEIKSGVVQAVTAGTDAMGNRPNHAKDDDKIKTSESNALRLSPEETTPKVETNLARKVIFPSPDKAQGMYTKEGIWQKIDAMRRIVGYKASRQASCMEELRALYLFTGVELSDSFNNASDLEEVNERLHFLLSVVGVE